MRRIHTYIALVAGVLLAASVAAAHPLRLGYGGRLADAAGQPVAGPVTLGVKLYKGAAGDQDAGVAVPDQAGVTLVDGVFALELALTGSEWNTLLGGDDHVWIEITDKTHGKAYAKQLLNVVPYALRVPVDNTTVQFNASGELTVPGLAGKADAASVTASLATKADTTALTAGLATKADTTHTHTLAGEVTGDLASTIVSKLITKPVDTVAPNTVGQVLKWDGTKWYAGTDATVGGGSITSGTNVGTGTALYKDAVAPDLRFKTVAGTAPLTITTPGAGDTVTFGIGQASGVADGYLAQSDFVAFNGKQSAITAASTVNAGTVTTALQSGIEHKPYGAAAGNTGEARFDELAANGTNYVALKAPDALGGNVTFTLPAADGTANQVLKTNGAGQLGWVAQPTIPANTDAVSEGATNLYFTQSRVRGALSASPPLSFNSGTGDFSLGTVGVASGGTGATSLTTNGILFGNGTGAVGATAAGTQYQVLQAGASGVPAFGALNLGQAAAITGTLPVGNGGTGAATANANLVFAGPASGGAAAPGFRALVAADISGLESDPQVNTVTASKWCVANAGGTAIDCTTNAPVLTESDPKVGTLTGTKWCTANAGGTAIDCTTNAPVTSESDPEVGANTTSYVPRWNGSALVTGTIYDNGTGVGIGTTTLTAGKLVVVGSGSTATDGLAVGNGGGGTSIRMWVDASNNGVIGRGGNSDLTMSPTGDVTISGFLKNQGRIQGGGGGNAPAGAGLGVQSGGDAVPTAILKARATQTADLLQVQTSGASTGDLFVVDASGNVGVGAATPGSKLTVAGLIESTTGGVKFPDGSTQTSAGAMAINGLTATTAPAGGDYVPVYSASAGANRKVSLADLLSDVTRGLAEGRLTLANGNPTPTSTSGATLYWTPYHGNRLGLYDGTRWQLYEFTQVSVALPTPTDDGSGGRNYDVFVYDNAGTLTLQLVAWTNTTTRATALATQDNIYVQSGAATRRYLGTARVDTAGTGYDTPAKRFVWNFYNRVQRGSQQNDNGVTTWSFNSTTKSAARSGAAAWKIEWVQGAGEDSVFCEATTFAIAPGTNDAFWGVAFDGVGTSGNETSAASATMVPLRASSTTNPSAGYHYCQAVTWTTGTAAAVTYYGNTTGVGGGVHASIKLQHTY